MSTSVSLTTTHADQTSVTTLFDSGNIAIIWREKATTAAAEDGGDIYFIVLAENGTVV